MNRDQLWKALFLPGVAKDYFAFDTLPPFESDHSDYNTANALILAELSRWSYNSEDAEARIQSAGDPFCIPYLEKAEIQETHYFMLPEAQASLLRAKDGSYHILVFRGTSKLQDWIANLNAPAVRWWGKGTVHKGFMEAFVKIWEVVAPALQDIKGPLFYAGHSLGGALATLTASLRAPTALYTFGSPRVGNRTFTESMEHIHVHRVVNRHDVVPTLPLPGGPLDYCHVGKLHRLGTLAKWNVLRVLAGFRMMWRQRKFALDRYLQSENLFRPPAFLMDHAPVNYVDRLKREYRHK